MTRITTGLAAVLTLAMVVPATADHHGKKNIVETAAAAGQFSTLLKAATEAGLAETLAEKGPFTVFAPTDEAFAALPEGTLEALLKDKEKLKAILLYHVVDGKVPAEKVVGLSGKNVKTLNGAKAKVMVEEGKVSIAGVNVVKTDVMASNGVIHVVDAVMMPPMKKDKKDYDKKAKAGNIVDVAKKAGKFNTLLTAATEAGLAETLASEGPFTVFAPTDEAFAAVPEATLNALLADKELLKETLLYHVVPGKVMAKKVVTMNDESVATASEQMIMIKVDGDKVMVGDESSMATVVATDVKASNGVIHVIDSVIVPPTVAKALAEK